MQTRIRAVRTKDKKHFKLKIPKFQKENLDFVEEKLHKEKMEVSRSHASPQQKRLNESRTGQE